MQVTVRAAVLTWSIALLPLAAMAQTTLYATGFEAPTFGVGPVGDTYGLPGSGQDGWLASPREPYATAPSPWVAVTTQRAYGGTQSLQLRMDTSFYNGVNGNGAAAWRDFTSTPIALNSQANAFSVSMRVYLDQATTSDLSWSLSMTTGVTGLGITLTPDNKVLFGHSLMNQGSTYTPGFDLHNSWLQLTLQRDPTDYTALRISLGNGAQSWQQLVTSPGGSMTSVIFGGVIPTFPVAAYGSAYLDDVRIGYNLGAVPEPGTWALALAGAGLLAVRRRRAGQPSARSAGRSPSR